MLALAGAFGWLVGAFHKAGKPTRRELESPYIRNGQGIVNLVGRTVSIHPSALGSVLHSRVARALDFCE